MAKLLDRTAFLWKKLSTSESRKNLVAAVFQQLSFSKEVPQSMEKVQK